MTGLLPRLCLAVSLLGGVLAVIPSYIKVCKRTDPDVNACITQSIEQLRPRLAKGIPELEAPAIEPLKLRRIRLLSGPTSAMLDLNITDLVVSGPSTFKVRDLRADVENVAFHFKVAFDKLSFRGKYSVNARILLLNLQRQGNLHGNFTNYDSEVFMKAEKVHRDNDVYLNFQKMKIAIKVGQADIYLDNLFDGDETLEKAANDILNPSSALFLNEIRPVLEDSLSNLFTNVANKITKSFTYDELFPL